MSKLILPREGKYLSVRRIGDCVTVRNYIETHYETQELRCFTFCGDDIRTWKFHSINSILTFYAYMLNHIGMIGFKLRLEEKLKTKNIGDPTRTSHPRFKKHHPPPS